MVGGTHYCITGTVGADIFWAGLVFGLGPTVVIFAKHTDKAVQDRDKGVLTLPVALRPVLGEVGVRLLIPSLALAQLAGAVFYSLFFGAYGLLGVLLGLPALYKLLRLAAEPRPLACPREYSKQAWPLWYTTYAFVYARNAGAGMLLGVVLVELIS